MSNPHFGIASASTQLWNLLHSRRKLKIHQLEIAGLSLTTGDSKLPGDRFPEGKPAGWWKISLTSGSWLQRQPRTGGTMDAKTWDRFRIDGSWCPQDLRPHREPQAPYFHMILSMNGVPPKLAVSLLINNAYYWLVRVPPLMTNPHISIYFLLWTTLTYS